MPDITRKETLAILLKFEVDANKANAAADEISKKFKKLGQDVSAFNIRDIGEKLNQVGQALTNTGQGLNNTLMGSVNAYITGAGKFDAKVQRWNAAQNEIQDAYARIGGVAIDKLTPYMEKAATLIDKLAGFVEQNPWIIEAVSATAALLTTGGAIISIVAQAMMLAGSIEKIGSFLKIGGVGGLTAGSGAAGKLALTAGGAAGAIAVGGTLIGGYHAMNAGNTFNRMIGQKEQSAGDVVQSGQAALGLLALAFTSASHALGITSKETSDNLFNTAKSLLGLGDAAKDAGDKTKSSMASFASKNVEAFTEYEKQKRDAALQYAEQSAQIEQDAANRRVEIIQSFADRVAQADSNYQRDNAKAQSSYLAASAQAAKEYHKQRGDAENNYQLETKRAAEDHQLEMERLQQEHDGRVTDLVANRDALGIVKENEAYARQRADTEGNYNTEASRKRQDYAMQMADLDANFQNQRAQRAQEYAAQQAERAQAHAQEMANLQKEKANQLAMLDKSTTDQLAKLKSAYDKQATMMQTAFIDRLNAMSGSILGSTKDFQDRMQADITRFQAWMKSTGFKLDGTKAAGGPVYDGKTYLVGEQGPELFTAPRDGSIVPAGLTASLLNPRLRNQGGSQNMTFKIETQSLTMTQVIDELDRRFKGFERGLGDAFANA